jgi:NADH:ubiquinone oxidoreductase subunit F (NADH-binding)
MAMPSSSITSPHPAGRNIDPTELGRRSRTLPGLLAVLPPDGSALDLAAFRRSFASPPVPSDRPRRAIIDTVEAAGLTGRGGAGFPTAIKMHSVAAGSGPRVVVANGTEGEPSSSKDALLATRNPHLVIDGALWAAAAVGAARVLICIERDNTRALAAVRRAVAERVGVEPSASVVEVRDTPPRYVAGEERALVRFINGGEAKPTVISPRPYQRGVDRRPTLIQNVETLAHVALAQQLGPEGFRRLGTPDEPGTMLMTVSGAVARPGIIEVPIGTPLGRVIDAAGGPLGPLQALLVGGFFGTWVPAGPAMAAPYSRAGLGPLGASPGAGIVVALPATACGLVETSRILAWYSAESAGQCGPCVHGLADLAEGSARLGAPAGGDDPVAWMLRVAGQVEGRGACRHPDGAVRLLRSALSVFAADVDRHRNGRGCAGVYATPTVRVPSSTAIWR